MLELEFSTRCTVLQGGKNNKSANLESEQINEVEYELTVVNLTSQKEYDFVNLSRKNALLSAYAMENGLMSNYIKNGYKSITGVEILEGNHCYSIGDLTVLKKRNIPQPKEVVSIFDNGGSTLDRYTICVTIDNTDFIVATNRSMSIWSVSESPVLYECENQNEDIGHAIEWDALPIGLQKHIKIHFEL